MAKGGKQPGAGRPKGSLNKTTKEVKAQREIFNKMVDEKWRPIIEAQLKEALKSQRARQYVIDQRIGRAQEAKKIDADIEITLDI